MRRCTILVWTLTCYLGETFCEGVLFQETLIEIANYHLQSSTSDLLFVPKVNTNMGTRAFAVGAPTLWNMLPSSVKSVENIAKFRRHLKTYLYNLAYPP